MVYILQIALGQILLYSEFDCLVELFSMIMSITAKGKMNNEINQTQSRSKFHWLMVLQIQTQPTNHIKQLPVFV